jgi:Uma2 family endonuclease
MTRRRATIDDLYRVEGRAELVNGEIRHLPLMEALPGRAGDEIHYSLHCYVRASKLGQVFGGSVAYHVSLPHRESFSPNVGLYTGPRTGMKFPEGAPVFAVEVRNSDDRGDREEAETAERRADYFAAGTLVVWDVDLLRDDIIHVYRSSSPNDPARYYPGDTADAEPAVPGWRMPVDDLFPAD